LCSRATLAARVHYSELHAATMQNVMRFAGRFAHALFTNGSHLATSKNDQKSYILVVN